MTSSQGSYPLVHNSYTHFKELFDLLLHRVKKKITIMSLVIREIS